MFAIAAMSAVAALMAPVSSSAGLMPARAVVNRAPVADIDMLFGGGRNKAAPKKAAKKAAPKAAKKVAKKAAPAPKKAPPKRQPFNRKVGLTNAKALEKQGGAFATRLATPASASINASTYTHPHRMRDMRDLRDMRAHRSTPHAPLADARAPRCVRVARSR